MFFHRPQQNEIQLLPREIPLLFEAVLFIWFGLIQGKLRNGISTKVKVEHAGFYSRVQETFFTSLRDLSEISRGGEGGWKQREGHNFLRLQKRKGS